MHCKYIPLIYFQQDAKLHSSFIYGKLLYMFRAASPPIMRSTYRCICSIWYLLNRYCYLPLLWISWSWFECDVGIVLICLQQDKLYTVHLFLENCSTCFGRHLHPSSVAHTTVFIVSGTCQTVTATCRYCGRVGAGLNVVWELYWSVLVRLRQQPHQNRSIQLPHHTQTSSN